MQTITESRIGRVALGVALGIAGIVSMALLGAPDAFAQATADADAVAAVTDATGTLEATIKAAIPLIAGVAVLWLVLGFVKRLIRRAG